MEAVSKKDSAAFNTEFQKGFSPDRINQSDGQLDLAILHAAAQDGSTEIVTTLLNAGMQPDLHLKSGETPLILASAWGRTDVARMLLDKGAKVDAGAESKLGSPLMATALGGYLETVRLLVERRAQVNFVFGCSTPLSVAAQNGHKEVVAFLSHSGAQSNKLLADMGPPRNRSNVIGGRSVHANYETQEGGAKRVQPATCRTCCSSSQS